MEVARGHVRDRPFARTVYTLCARRFTGDLILIDGSRRYKTSWEDGRVVAADSASPADSPGRIALTAGLVSSTTVSQMLRRLDAEPSADPLAVLAEVGKLSDKQVNALERRVLAHAAARLFALPNAELVADNARSLRADAEVPPLDPRWLIYFGLRTHYSVERLERELQPVATARLSLAEDALASLRSFGFGDSERPVLGRLRGRGLTIEELAKSSPELDRSAVLALIYALVSCDCLEVGPGRRASMTAPLEPEPEPEPTPPRPSTTQPVPRVATSPTQLAARAKRSTLAEGTLRSQRFVAAERSGTSPVAKETRTLIRERLGALDADADHYALLGVPRDATDSAIRVAYFHLAKRLHPDRLRAIGVLDMAAESQRLFAAINEAFSVLSDPRRAADYKEILAAGGAKAVERAQREAEELASKIFAAEEHFRIGEMALRRNQLASALTEFGKARELNREEGEYDALWAWTKLCHAAGASGVESEVENAVTAAVDKAPNNANVHLYRGRVLKKLGREDAARDAFETVLELRPDHHDATLELRVLSSRKGRATMSGKGGGLFGKKRR